MNTKKSKKNRPNKPNPIPTPSVEVKENETQEKTEVTQENLDLSIKSDERVPEIVTDVAASSETNEDVENDSPKKPKRNRGKKKKHDKEYVESVVPGEPEQIVSESTKETSEQFTHVDLNAPYELPTDKMDKPHVTPTARKKKGKNKLESDVNKISEAINRKPEIEIVEPSKGIKEILQETMEIDEIAKPPKKKNKKNKKNRNYSEKSESVGEPSCLTEFQKIIQPEHDDKPVEISEIKDVLSDSSVSEATVKEVDLKSSVIESNMESIQVSMDNPEDDFQKIKKKNKKDKKQQSKNEFLENIKIVQLEVIANPQKEDKSLDIKTTEETVVETQLVENQEQVQDIYTVKQKAKIAKPVEKKSKDKQHIPVEEQKLEKIKKSHESFKDPKAIDVTCAIGSKSELIKLSELSESPEIKEEKPINIDQFQKNKKDKTKQSKNKEMKQKEIITDVLESRHDKVEQPITTLNKSEDIIKAAEILTTEGHKIASDLEQESQPKDVLSETGIKIIEEENPSTIIKEPTLTEDNISPDVFNKSQIGFKDEIKITDTTTANINTENILTNLECKNLPENISQHRNKSPKPPKKHHKNKGASLNTPDVPSEKCSEPLIVGEDIKTELRPDIIEHPRATSADIIDGNNNMLIQEIANPDFNLSIILDTPLIQSSEEMPTPDVVIPLKRSENREDIPKEVSEKTDIKSKMIEVNKDMEGLRLSIEKSLAEFSALEIENDNIDKGFTQSLTSDKKVADPLPEKMKAFDIDRKSYEKLIEPFKTTDLEEVKSTTPEPPQRKDNKGKSKSKKKGKPDLTSATVAPENRSTSEATGDTQKSYKSVDNEKSGDKESQQKRESQQSDSKSSQKQGKQQSTGYTAEHNTDKEINDNINKDSLEDFDKIENFEDALTSSVDDVNKTFELIADEIINEGQSSHMSINLNNPEISVTEPDIDENKEQRHDKENPIVSKPKNLLGHPIISATSNKSDYKKEKNKTPNTKLARVKIKDAVDVEKKTKESKQSQTENKPKLQNANESVTCVTSENDEFIYKYSFRKVFLSSNCHVCHKDLKNCRVPCNFCNLIFYCSIKHRDENYAQHQAFCFAIATLIHLKGQKHIYADTQSITGHNYRLLRMQMIVACEKVLKRKLMPWEQESLLYPRICADPACREWRQGKLIDCDGCAQISFCSENPDHFPKSHSKWCKSYALYRNLVVHQLTVGRLEPKLPTRLLTTDHLPDNINLLLADLYAEKIDMNEMQYAALTQLATGPLTIAYCYQLYYDKMKTITNGAKNSTFTVHVVGAELQFEADSLNKWEIFLLHLKPQIEELRIVLIGPELNPSSLPLELLGKIKLCATCRLEKRRLHFKFQDKQLYHQYYADDDFITPDIVCALSPSLNRSSSYNDTWTDTINCVIKQKVPFVITSYTMNELQRDMATIKNVSKYDINIILEANFNSFSSVRPDRNFITDDELPLLFKNYCYAVVIGAF